MKRWKVKKSKPQVDTRFNVENHPSTWEGKTEGASQQALHYDRSPVTNANGVGLQEVEWIGLQ
jgi:hypothetical protein